ENLAAYPYCQIGRTENEAGADFDVAEILGYSNALSPSDEALVGGYLAAKYGIATTYPATGSLANQAASAITTTTAAINATLLSNSNTYNVVAYWGPDNGGINPANWANSVSLGSGLNAASINLSQTLTNLVPGTTYYFNCCATNGTQTIWAAASQSFATTSTSKDFLTFGANVSGSYATIDTVARTVAWTVPFGTPLTSLAPAYTVSAQATGTPASGATLNFSAPQTYTLTGQDGSTKVYTVTVAADHTYPASSAATLTAAEDVPTALAAANFGYADPNSLALAAVQITALPLQGTLRLSGTAVTNGDIVTAANIPNLTYQPVLYAYGTPYTTIGIKVMNSNNVWSIADSVMTVNVAYANHPPTSTAAAFTMKGGSYYTFWKTDFPFTDVDAGDWLISVKMTSLPAHGTLTLGGTPITTVPSAAIPATSTNTLIYTPNSSYLGADSFNYQVSDGKAFSANAAMAITVVDPNLIFVLNGSFETPGGSNGPDWAFVGAPWTHSGGPWGQVHRTGTNMPALTGGGAWIANLNDSGVGVITQNLLTSVGAGDTLTVTFFVGRDSGGSGVLQASFMIDGTAYSQNFDTSTQTANTWQSYTLTKTIIEPGNLSLRFSNVSGHVSWLDLVSNVTITPAAVVAANAPTTSGGVLTAVQDTATALSSANFGYSDPNSVALGSVQIIALPVLGTLKSNGSAVASGAIVGAANLANLTYQGALNGYGSPYTKIGIKVANANNVWSSTAWLTVNVTPINHAPTSIGAAVILKPNTVKTFAATDFPFADIDAGDTLGAIKVVTSLPAHGTLSLNGTPITSVPSAVIPVANIGTLTYTPAANYLGADSFKYQVRDAALFSADATMAISVSPDIMVLNGSFETTGAVTDTNWAHIASVWHPSPDSNYGQSHWAAAFASAADGIWYANFTDAGFSITQDLLSSVHTGDVLSVTFYLGKDTTQSGVITATFRVGSTPYSQSFDTTSQGVGTWAAYTMTKTLANAGNLSLQFSNLSGRVWLDKISHITVTPTSAPNSTNAMLTATEDIATPLAAGNFGYADPNLAALAAVQITSLPTLGTLKYNGTTVVSGMLPLTVAAANIGNLIYQSALYGFGTPYTTFGVMVENTNGLWSIGTTTMTVNVTHVNHAPTSAGGSASLPTGTVKTFAVGDFPFSDVDTGDVLSAIKITSLPAHGTLSLGGTNITTIPSAAIPVANIGTLTYTPTTNYSGNDSFKYQVNDATVFSADATMAVTVNYAKYITVLNGSFDITNPGDNTWSDGNWMYIPSPWTTSMGGYGRIRYSSAPVGFPALAGGGTWMANMMNSANWVNQNLGSQSFSAGDTISVTFDVGKDNSGSGVLQASFLVGATTYSQTFDTTTQTVNTWQSYTLTQTIPTAVTANLTLKFSTLSGRGGWLDNISNVSVMAVPVAATYASWATANSVTGGVTGDTNHDGVPNGIAYFMGATGPATLPGIIGNTVTWTNGGNIPSSAYGSQFVVKTSSDLVNWTPVAAGDPKLSNTAGSVSYTLPPGAGKLFVRLVVSPN
ncbi:MAG: cadherin-like domain-containing protein, partial [Verrucomicrobiota bacterium]